MFPVRAFGAGRDYCFRLDGGLFSAEAPYAPLPDEQHAFVRKLDALLLADSKQRAGGSKVSRL